MRRKSNRFLNGEWTVQCATPPSDPREESGTYTLTTVSDSELRYRDVSRYNWQLRESRCVATMRTVQTLKRALPSSATESQKPAAVASTACTPGKATRLVLRPARAELELGEELCVRAAASDAHGCPLHGAPIQFSLRHSPVLRGSLQRNCFRSSDNAAEGEGTFTILATLQALQAQTTVQVAAMDLSALIAKRLDVGAVTGFDEAPATEDSAPLPTKTGVTAKRTLTESSAPSMMSLLLAAAAIAILLVTLLQLRRSRRQAFIVEPETIEALTPPSEPKPRDHETVAEISTATDNWICPTCHRGFPSTLQTCPTCPGSVALLPYSVFVAAERPRDADKRCTECGARCSGAAQFCGECGGSKLETTERG